MADTFMHFIHVFTAALLTFAAQSPLAMMVVGAYAGTALILYGLTRGREFLIVGYSSVLFLVPFVHWV